MPSNHSTRFFVATIALASFMTQMTPNISPAEELQATLERLAQNDEFSGAVLLAKGDDVLFKAAVGLASRRYNIDNEVDTKFNVGSMNKMFTSVAILQLAQSGKLKLNDPIGKHVDESWLPPETAVRIQIRHLLSHSSGLGDYFVDEFWDTSRLQYLSLDDYKPLVASTKLEFEPGSKKSYSNAGFLLLGKVIEEVSGSNYEDYIRLHICEPAGMQDTACYDIRRPVPNLAKGYYRQEGEKTWTENSLLHTVRGGPAGGGYSTVEDLYRFSRALTTFRLLDREYTKRLLVPSADGQTFGFEHEMTPIGPVVGHSGGFPGIMCKLEIHAKSNITAIILCNLDKGGIPVLRALHQHIASTNPDLRSRPQNK
ncbi:MAG: serine hydrolase domain-containing protein [Planctomycetota bacterium]